MSALFAEFADVEHKRTAAMQRILQRYAALLQRNQGGFDVHVKEVCRLLASLLTCLRSRHTLNSLVVGGTVRSWPRRHAG